MNRSISLARIAGLSLALLSANAFSHGEDAPGPHGGVIRMPGAFHTELKKENDRQVQIYLLDMNWKNPTTEKSSLRATLVRGAEKHLLSCEPEKDAYVCTTPGKLRFRTGDEVSIEATRGGAAGIPVRYSYPFSPPDVSPGKSHSHH